MDFLRTLFKGGEINLNKDIEKKENLNEIVNENVNENKNKNENKNENLNKIVNENVNENKNKNLNKNKNEKKENNNEVNEITKNVNEINKGINKVENKNSLPVEEIKNMNEEIKNINKKNNSNIPLIKDIHVNKDRLFDEIGILDPEGKNINPLTGEAYKNLYIDIENRPASYAGYAENPKGGWSKLPTYKERKKVIETLYKNQCILLTAGTGSGKTVLTPKFLLHVLNYQGKIAITIPRKVPTKGAAIYAAKTLDVVLGEQVGYSVKGDKKSSSKTKLLYTTDGTILAKLNGFDPLLEEFDSLIIDEAHERNPNIDQILLLIKKVLRARPKFKLVIMSATINPETFINYYKEFNIKYIELPQGSYFPVEPIFLKTPINNLRDNQINGKVYIEKAAEIIWKEIIEPEKEGDILVLIPSPGEGVQICQGIDNYIKRAKKNKEIKPFCITLEAASGRRKFGEGTQQNYAIGTKDYKNLNSTYTRRIITASEVAESSVTFDGDPINFVIDTGLANINKYYPLTEIDALEKRYIAKANQMQRRGRTGRKGPGICYNLFTEKEYENFLDYPIPKIVNESCEEIVLNLLSKPFITHVDLPFIYPKKISNVETETESLNSYLSKLITQIPVENVVTAIKRLFLIKAISITGKKGFITNLGKIISGFSRDSISPEKATAIIHSYNYKCSDEVINIMALLTSVEDRFDKIFTSFKSKVKNKNSKEFKEEKEHYDKTLKKLSSSYGDHISLYKIMKTYKEKNYFIKRERGREVLESKGIGEGTEWAKNNFVNAKKLKKAIDISKDLKRPFAKAISQYKRENPDKSYIYRDTEPVIHDKIEDNIMQAITEGFIGNIAQKVGRNYTSCFPIEKSVAQIDRASLFNNVSVKPSTGLYNSLIGIFGSKKFQVFSKVPTKVVSTLRNDNKTILKLCKKERPSSHSKFKKFKSSKKKYSKKRFRRS